jgi:molybdopterin molybdotransferase
LPAAFSTTRISDRREFARGRITPEQGIELYANQGSGILSSLSWAEALVELPENTLIHPGDLVNVHLLSELLA